MSKLDELGKKEFGFKELAHILWNADTEYDLQQMLEFHVAIVKNRVAREARLEEREVMRKFVDGINGKMIMCKNGCIGGLACSDCGIKEEWIKKSDLLNELNK